MEPLVAALQAGRPARTAIPPEQEEAVRRLQLLTSKPVLYVCNVEEGAAATGNAFSARVRGAGDGRRRARRGRVGRDRGRGGAAAGSRSRASSWKGSACTTAAWIG